MKKSLTKEIMQKLVKMQMIVEKRNSELQEERKKLKRKIQEENRKRSFDQ